jgi:hypothetical protein
VKTPPHTHSPQHTCSASHTRTVTPAFATMYATVAVSDVMCRPTLKAPPNIEAKSVTAHSTVLCPEMAHTMREEGAVEEPAPVGTPAPTPGSDAEAAPTAATVTGNNNSTIDRREGCPGHRSRKSLHVGPIGGEPSTERER